KKLDARSAFSHEGAQSADAEMAACCVSAVWLLHDCLDESHIISQDIGTTSGSFLHAIMHRREGDFSNAKYWFRRVGHHPVIDELAANAHELNGAFDPAAFVDACQTALRSGGAAADFCRRVQQLEWELLFDHSYRRA